jgi:hypothetical protein
MVIDRPGLYNITEAQYHADPVITPSLSHSIAKLVIDRSPRHAMYAHPRLSIAHPDDEEDDDTKSSIAGSVIHKLILGKGAVITEIKTVYDAKHELAGQPVRNFLTKAAKEEKAAILARGGLPVTKAQAEKLRRAAAECMSQIDAHPELKGFNGPNVKSEAVIVWQERGVWCRAMVDRLNIDSGQIYDLKTTKLSAAPWSWERRLQTEYATQDDFYRRGLRALGYVNPPPTLFIPVEQDAPFCISSITPDNSLQVWADQEMDRAISTWGECLASNNWPGYPAVTYHVNATGWMLTQQEARAEGAAFKTPARRNFAESQEWEMPE